MSRTLFLLPAAVMSLVSLSSAARADDKKVCSDAYEKAQSLRDEGKLVGAREQMRVCARTTCVKFIAKDCATWLADVESRLPSVVLAATDATGASVTEATVSMDGAVLTRQLDGHAVDVDPGKHTFTFALPDGSSIDQPFVVAEGQKAQRVAVSAKKSDAVASNPVGTTPAAPAEGAAPAGAGEDTSTASSWNGRKTLAVVVGGAGIAGIAVGSIFGITAMSAWSRSKNECNAPAPSPGCPDVNAYNDAVSDKNKSSSAASIATVGFIAGGVLAAAGVVLFVTAPRGAEQPNGAFTSLAVVPSVGPGGGGAWLRGAF